MTGFTRSTADPALTGEHTATREQPDIGLPARARHAVTAMYVGLALTVAAAVAVIVDQTSIGLLSRHLEEVYAGYAASGPAVSMIRIYLLTTGAVGVVTWLWMVWAVRARKRWAPAVATVIFVLATVLASANFFIQEYGQALIPAQFALAGLLPCLAGLVAVVLLWTRDRR